MALNNLPFKKRQFQHILSGILSTQAPHVSMTTDNRHYDFKGIFGILNITADSFSDGGLYLHSEKALNKAVELINDGADMLDVGSVSSNPDGKNIDSATEIERILPVFNRFEAKKSMLSIDTYNPETQRYFIEKKVGWINDIRGFEDSSVYDHLKHFNGKLILMHAVQKHGRADFSNISPDGILEKAIRFFEARLNQLSQSGIDTHKIVLDPGMGFFIGTDPACSISILKNINKLRTFNRDILISVSKKSFLRNISGLPVEQIENVNTCAEIMAVLGGANYIRTHTPKTLSEAKLYMDYYFNGDVAHA